MLVAKGSKTARYTSNEARNCDSTVGLWYVPVCARASTATLGFVVVLEHSPKGLQVVRWLVEGSPEQNGFSRFGRRTVLAAVTCRRRVCPPSFASSALSLPLPPLSPPSTFSDPLHQQLPPPYAYTSQPKTGSDIPHCSQNALVYSRLCTILLPWMNYDLTLGPSGRVDDLYVRLRNLLKRQ